MQTRKNYAFTLIELLVVIAIIAILAAILFPVFAQAREKARQVTCTSNEKQIGLAIMQYVQDYDEKYPDGYWGNQTPGYSALDPQHFNEEGPGQGWYGEVYPYLKSTAVVHCPDDTYTPDPNGVNAAKLSYGYNVNLSNGGSGLADGQLNAPASTVMTYEIAWCLVDPLNDYYHQDAASGVDLNGSESSDGMDAPGVPNWNGYYETGMMGGSLEDTTNGGGPPYNCSQWEVQGGSAISSQHSTNGGANFLMADGHVKFMLGQYISNGATAPSATSPPVENAASGGAADPWGQWDGSGSPPGATAAGTGDLTSGNYAATFSPI